MRRLNLHWLAALVAGCVVLAIVVSMVHRFQVRRNAVAFLEMARSARAENRLLDAAYHYGIYLRHVGTDTDAKEEMGFCLSDLQQYRNAFDILEDVMRQDPERTKARRRLIDVALAMDLYSHARQHVEHLLKSNPDDADLLRLRGRCQEADQQYDAAAGSYRLAIENAPEDPESYALLAEVLRRRLGNPAEADAAMEQLVKANPQLPAAYIARGSYRKMVSEVEYSAGRSEATTALLQGAAEDAGRALKLLEESPSEEISWKTRNTQALMLAAQCAQRQGRSDAAREFARRGVEAVPQYAPLYNVLAEIETTSGQRREAIAWLRRGLEKVADRASLIWSLASLLIDEGQLPEAQQCIEQLQTMEYDAPRVGYLRARIEYAEGRWLQCSQILERILSQLHRSPELVKQAEFWLGNCYDRLGNIDQQLTAYRRAADLDPRWPLARQGMVKALVAMGRVDEGLAELNLLMALPQAPAQGWLELARLSILKNLRLDRTQRNWEEVGRILDRAAVAFPELVYVPILRAEVLVAENRPAEAEKLLLDARGKYGKDAELWVGLVSLAQRQQNWDAVERYLAEADEKVGDQVALRLARGRYLVLRYGKQASARLRSLADKSERISAEEYRKLAFGLALLDYQSGDQDQARLLCEMVASQEPSNLQIRLLLFDLALQAGDYSNVEQTLKEIRAIEGTGPLWHYGYAVYYQLRGLKEKEGAAAWQKALENLTQAGAMRPAWSRVPRLAGEIYERLGNTESAIQHYLRAIELGERGPATVQRVVQLLSLRQRYGEADRVLRQLEEQQSPFSADLARMAAEVSLQLDYLDRALEIARQMAAQSTEYRDHLWFGQLLHLMGQRGKLQQQDQRAEQMFAEAEREFRLAVKFAEQAPETWFALVQFLARTQREKEAEATIALAQTKIPPAKAPLALAQCYEGIGRLEEAEKKYLAALETAPDDPAVVRGVAEFYLRIEKPAKAEPYLSRMVSTPLSAAEGEVLWARRNLAVALLARRDFPSLDRARQLIEENLKLANPALADFRVEALVLSAHPKRERRREAIQIWDKALRDPLAATEDRFLLAELQRSLGNWAEYTRQMRSILSLPKTSPRYLAAYVRALLKRAVEEPGELLEAEVYLKRLESVAAAEFQTVELQAQALCQRGQYDQAASALKAILDRPDAVPPDRADRLRLAAAKLEEFAGMANASGKRDAAQRLSSEAESLYRQLIEQRPERTLLLARFLARQRRLDDALSIAESAWLKESPEAIAEVVYACIAGGTATSEQQKRIESLLAAALEKHHRAVPLLLVSAELYASQHKFPAVEAAYREVLQSAPDHFLALNNLAMLLAVQGSSLTEAEEMINRAIRRNGPLPALLDTRAAVYLAQGKSPEASADLYAAITEKPDAVAYFHQAQVRLLQGEREKAVESLKEAQQRGLKPEQLHPLERPNYEKMMELARTASA